MTGSFFAKGVYKVERIYYQVFRPPSQRRRAPLT